MNIIGKKFLVDFGMAKAILDFQGPTSLAFTIMEKEGMEVNIKETVEINLTQLQPQLYMATWKEASGTTVIQIQDYEQGIIYLPSPAIHKLRETSEFKSLRKAINNFSGTQS